MYTSTLVLCAELDGTWHAGLRSDLHIINKVGWYVCYVDTLCYARRGILALCPLHEYHVIRLQSSGIPSITIEVLREPKWQQQFNYQVSGQKSQK